MKVEIGGPNTKEQIVKEVIACGRDPTYFIKNYCRIQHPVQGLIPLREFGYQHDIARALVKNRFNIILKGRQLGVSTIIALYATWFILFHRDKNVLVIASKQETAQTVIRMVRIAINALPHWLMLTKIQIDNRLSIELSNGSRIKSIASTHDAGRSEAVSFLIIDEASVNRNIESVWAGLWPTVSTGGRIVISSTPKGTGNFFHKMYIQAQNGENEFNCRFGSYTNPHNPSETYNDRFMWWVHPEYDLQWFQSQTMGKSPREVAEEYACNFAASGDTFIFADDIKRLEASAKEPRERTNFDHNLWIWEYPTKGGIYLITTDVSRGDASDFSTFHVIRMDTKLQQVAEYKGKVTPDVLGLILIETSKKYGNAVIVIETTGGWAGQTIQKIKEANFPFLYYSSRRRDKTFIDPYIADTLDYAVPGYCISSFNRLPMLAKMEQYIRLDQINLFSSRLVEELKTFVWMNNRPSAQKGYHDDLVMSLAGGIWVREESFMAAYRGTQASRLLVDNISFSSTKMDYNASNSVYDRVHIKDFVANQHKIVTSDGTNYDISWLLDARISKG